MRTRLLILLTVVIAALTGSAVPASADGASVQTLFTETPYWFQNNATGLCMDSPSTGAPGANAPVTQYHCRWGDIDNQVWKIRATRVVNGVGLYQIYNNKGGYCLDVPARGAQPAGALVSTNFCTWPPQDDNQEWHFDGDASINHFLVINYKSGLCLDVSGAGGSGGPDARLTLYYCSIIDDHVWHIW